MRVTTLLAGNTCNFWQGLRRPIIGLAPMDGVSDAAFRRIVARRGVPDVTFTEFTSVMDICRGPEALLASLRYDDSERPIVAQLYGKDPDLFYQAAHVVCELGFDGLDVNMGCPSRNVAGSGSGAGLIRTPARARAILEATRQGIEDWVAGQTLEQAQLSPRRAQLIRSLRPEAPPPLASPRRPIPVSVKTRLGYDSVVVEDWVRHLLDCRPAAITLHGRTLAQMYRGEADWEAIARGVTLARGSGTLMLGNGDVQSLADVVRRVRETGVDGVLIGRGTLGAPWFFQDKEAARVACPGVADPPAPPSVTLAARFEAMLEHARLFEQVFDLGRFPRMRKHLAWYCKGFPHAAAMRASLVHASSSADVERLVREHLRSLAGAATHADTPALLVPGF